MAIDYILRDHTCKELEDLVSKKRFYLSWFVCDCSPCERSYEMLVNNRWESVNYCPFCGSRIKMDIMNSFVVLNPTD